MAIYIVIRKVRENEGLAEYAYGFQEDVRLSTLVLDRKTGEITPLTGDSESSGRFSRAAFVVRKHWEKGELPEETWWAS